MLNLAYAVLAERADADDLAEMALLPHVDEKARPDLCRNRDGLDAWLAEPMGREAAAEQALLTYLGGAA